MSEVELIEAAGGAARWDAALAPFADADVYARHGYVRAAAGDSAFLAIVREGPAALAVPLRRDPLPTGGGWDAESPYGFPGVLTRGDASTCWPALARALAERGIVNAFLRLHPFADQAACAPLVLGTPKPTAWIPLGDGREHAFDGSECATHRSQASRALHLGFVAWASPRPSPEELDEFQALYDATMTRLEARPAYRFGQDYFQALAAGLGDDLVLLRVASADGALQAAALLLLGPRYGHYHLSARSAQSHNAAGHLLFEAMADQAAARGLLGVHLGGGLSERADDPLWLFKRRIGRGRTCCAVAGLVCDPLRHEQLVAAWRERSQRPPSWFQAYRQPLEAGL